MFWRCPFEEAAARAAAGGRGSDRLGSFSKKYAALGDLHAQVHGLRDQHSSEEKARFDLQYIFNWSPFLDLSLIVQTVWTVLIRGLRQEPVVPQAVTFRSQTNNVVAEELVDANRS